MSITCPILIPLARSLCPIPGNGACDDPTTISAAAHSRLAPTSPRALARTRTTTCGPHLLPFSRSSFAVKKDSKSQRTTGHHPYFSRTNNNEYQQAYMQQNIAVHTRIYLMHAGQACTDHLHAGACKDMVIRHRPFACTVHANGTLPIACKLGTVHRPVVVCSHALQ